MNRKSKFWEQNGEEQKTRRIWDDDEEEGSWKGDSIVLIRVKISCLDLRIANGRENDKVVHLTLIRSSQFFQFMKIDKVNQHQEGDL
jgi:hypothetical protein